MPARSLVFSLCCALSFAPAAAFARPPESHGQEHEGKHKGGGNDHRDHGQHRGQGKGHHKDKGHHED